MRLPQAPPIPDDLKAQSLAEDSGGSGDVALHWRQAQQLAFGSVMGPLFDSKTGQAVVPVFAEDTAPAEGNLLRGM